MKPQGMTAMAWLLVLGLLGWLVTLGAQGLLIYVEASPARQAAQDITDKSFRIPTEPIFPALLEGEFVLVNKYAYGDDPLVTQHETADSGASQGDDGGVFHIPGRAVSGPIASYIIRIVGWPAVQAGKGAE